MCGQSLTSELITYLFPLHTFQSFWLGGHQGWSLSNSLLGAARLVKTMPWDRSLIHFVNIIFILHLIFLHNFWRLQVIWIENVEACKSQSNVFQSLNVKSAFDANRWLTALEWRNLDKNYSLFESKPESHLAKGNSSSSLS